MERNLLYSTLVAQQKDFIENKKLVNREETEEMMKLVKLKMPIFITGVRRCGKSCLLSLLKDKLALGEKQYLYINFNDDRFANFAVEDFQKIIDFITEEGLAKDCVLFIDEIHEVDRWEKWIDRIKEKYTIFITGSNSKLLSKEISSILTGRSININLMPFSFKEFLLARGTNFEKWKTDLEMQSNIRKKFKEFVEIGGFPKRVLENESRLTSELYENILHRDVIGKLNKKLEKPAKEVSIFLISNASSLFSYREIAKMIQTDNRISKSIIQAFENSFLFFFVNKFDYSIKKQTQNPKKIYCIDNGFLSSLAFKLSENKGNMLENLVAIELKRRNKEMFYSKEKNECDFVVREKAKITEAIQVCYNLDNKNKSREEKGLLEALDKFNLKEGLILTYDQEEEFKVGKKTIKVLPVWKWLLKEK